jgi:hypothetical protein
VQVRLSVPEILEILEGGPSQIRAATGAVEADRLHVAPRPGEWSANEVLAHLRACADVWGGYISTILEEDQPVIRALNPRRWIRDTDYVDRPFRASLRAYATQRARLLGTLRPLSDLEWARTATVRGAGAPREETVLSYAFRLARHERTHVEQIVRVARALAR